MLDTETKRRINTARDILVGKVPDPKAQVEQITLALIYKFMDDMDAESEALGGKRSFFTGEFARYGWAKLMGPGTSGQERLNLYAEGITRMTQNTNLPELFRRIFSNAYLPYRDPETLRLFLKVIGEFSYDHSERLGDAFEYLLSVLGAQGDAGQFRTPRHIIDFIVEIIAPRKDETILDPACGTAGFLISAWKHILRTNTDSKGIVQLTLDERSQLAGNITGYDISPDMARLSRVNLYLHGFAAPHIAEYDTLTQEERWGEHADVILANPPFMSPKGGIRPHHRFSIQASRSEVLFVDYMAEHLSAKGRAGIIVPEGIIFQSQGAYRSLRKMLVQESLVAVISLPAGCFNPYSGVKTSILILDKSLAKRAKTIAFFRVDNDGYGLGAQRRPIDRNDLPRVRADVETYFAALREGKAVEGLSLATGLVVPKERIAGNDDYNLSGERYREGTTTNSAWLFVPVGNVFKKSTETVLPETLAGSVTYLGLENIAQHTGNLEGNTVDKNPAEIKSLKNVFQPNDILYGKLRPNLNKVWLADRKGICSTDIFVIKPENKNVESTLYAYLFRSSRFNDMVMRQIKGAQLPRVAWSSFSEIQIPLPPLEVQQQIVDEVEGYQKVIDGARAVVDNYRPHIDIDPDWPVVELGKYFITTSGGTPSKSVKNYWNGNIPWVSPKDMKADIIVDTEDHISEEAISESATKLFQTGTIVCVVRSGILKHSFPVACLSQPMCINQDLIAFQPKGNDIIPKFLFYVLKTCSDSILASGIKPGVTVQSFYNGFFKKYKLPLPPLDVQRAIVADIEAEQTLVAANRTLIERMEKKIQNAIARVWGS